MSDNKSSNVLLMAVTLGILVGIVFLAWFLFSPALKNTADEKPMQSVATGSAPIAAAASQVTNDNPLKTDVNDNTTPASVPVIEPKPIPVADKPHKPGPTKQFIAKVKTEAYLESESVFLTTNQGEMQLFAFGMDDASSTAVARAKPGQCLRFTLQEAVTVPKKHLVFESGFSVKKVACP